MIRLLILLLFFIPVSYHSGLKLTRSHQALPTIEDIDTGGLYLPRKNIIGILSFNYKTAASDLLWFNLNNYFGKHYDSDRKYRWFKHMCELVYTLDPRAAHVYEFCALMHSWELNRYQDANEILAEGLKNLPHHWRFYFMRGLNYRIFEGNNELAMKEFQLGADIPDSPSYMKTMATKLMSNIDGPHAAVSFLKQTIARTQDKTQKEVLMEQLKRTIHTITLDEIDKQCEKVLEQSGNMPTSLRECGIEAKRDPAGGHYFINPETGKADSNGDIEAIPLFAEHLKGKIKPRNE